MTNGEVDNDKPELVEPPSDLLRNEQVARDHRVLAMPSPPKPTQEDPQAHFCTQSLSWSVSDWTGLDWTGLG